MKITLLLKIKYINNIIDNEVKRMEFNIYKIATKNKIKNENNKKEKGRGVAELLKSIL